MFKPFHLLLGTFVAFLLVVASCRKEEFYGNSDARLEFSTDTVMFDTVFTKLGGGPNPRSANRRFTVRNPYKETIKTNIRLAGGQASPFRINVDGIPSLDVKDYEIRAEDSIYVFVEVTIDPNNVSNPLIVQDSIEFITNGNRQDVKLVAWGQDAYYFADSVLDYNSVWADKSKPYVIYNYLYIDRNNKLTIEEGVKVYSAVNSRLFVEGTLEVNGTKDEPVVFQGARLEQGFRNTASQWYGIRFLPKSKDNKITYAEIKNGVIGVQVDSLQDGGGVKLDISQTRILNMSAAGLVGYTAWIRATNVLSANCGLYTFLGELGGNYQLTHCTFANYNTTFSRSKPAFGLSNADYKDANGVVTVNPLTYSIRNCIIWGSLKEELVFFEGGAGAISKGIDHTVIRSVIQGLNVNNNMVNIDPKFRDYRELNFELDTLSPAKDKAVVLAPPVTIDLKGELRDNPPDPGAFERKE